MKNGKKDAKGGGDQAQSAPSFSEVSGSPHRVGAAHTFTSLWHATSLQDKKAVVVRAEELDPAQTYHLGYSWWDYGNGGRKRKIRVTSVDGEVSENLVKPTVLPGWVHDRELAKSAAVALPSQVNMDGTVTIRVEKLKGPSAVVSELLLYGKGEAGGCLLNRLTGRSGGVGQIGSFCIRWPTEITGSWP